MAKWTKVLLCFLLIATMLVGCKKPTSDSPVQEQRESLQERLDYYTTLGSSPDDNYRTWYQILIYSFCDSNGDGVGDLQGLISKLDYIQNLGITGLWLSPIHPSGSYHGYDVDDYYAINPDFGTMEDFDQLLQECDNRGIKVVLDLVVNHTSADHPWYTAALDYIDSLGLGGQGLVSECKYFGYYNFVESDNVPDGNYTKVPGTIYHVECDFGANMHDLNWDSEDLRADVEAVMKFWLDKGVHGFRVDAAKHFYPGTSRNIEVLKWLQETASAIKPDVYMVAEVWIEGSVSSLAQYYESGFTSLFNFALCSYTGKLMTVVNCRGNGTMANTWASTLQSAEKLYTNANPNYIDASFISNHDMGRSFNFAGRDEDRAKLAGAFNLFMSGSAYVYYGEEIGMLGGDSDPDQRAPMYWNAQMNDGTTTAPPGCTISGSSHPLGSLADQVNDEYSIYNYYREAIAIRNAIPAIARGKQTVEEALNQECISAIRKTWNDQECIILYNLDTKSGTVDLSDYADWTLAGSLSVGEEWVKLDGTNLSMPSLGAAVLIPKN